MKVGKPKSKRVPVRLRHKIEKASANKQRKDRKDAKKNPQWRSRLKKDPGIPNLFPYKDKILSEIEESKRKKEEEQQRKRDLAKAQREGKKVTATTAVAAEDEDLVDPDEDVEGDEDEEMGEESANPMAALLASAQARAQTYKQGGDDDEEDEDDSEEEEFQGVQDSKPTGTAQPARRALPQQALADPMRAASALIARLESTQDGMQQLLAYYQLPPLVTAGSDTTTRFLVDVARKRGRLGRGGIPNLHAAALTVLSDINEERLRLPALDRLPQASKATSNKGEVQIVSQLAEPFRIEGLFGDTFGNEKAGQGMEIES